MTIVMSGTLSRAGERVCRLTGRAKVPAWAGLVPSTVLPAPCVQSGRGAYGNNVGVTL